jgi:hypothetical protein
MENLPHVVMTSDVDWDPSVLDGEFPLEKHEEIRDALTYDNGTNFDVFGNYKLGTIVASAHVLRDHPVLTTTVIPDAMVAEQRTPEDVDHESSAYEDPTLQIPPKPPPTSQDIVLPDDQNQEVSTLVHVSPHTSPSKLDPSSLRKFFAFLPTEVVSRTLSKTTQYARVPNSDMF